MHIIIYYFFYGRPACLFLDPIESLLLHNWYGAVNHSLYIFICNSATFIFFSYFFLIFTLCGCAHFSANVRGRPKKFLDQIVCFVVGFGINHVNCFRNMSPKKYSAHTEWVSKFHFLPCRKPNEQNILLLEDELRSYSSCDIIKNLWCTIMHTCIGFSWLGLSSFHASYRFINIHSIIS